MLIILIFSYPFLSSFEQYNFINIINVRVQPGNFYFLIFIFKILSYENSQYSKSSLNVVDRFCNFKQTCNESVLYGLIDINKS